MEKNGSCSAAFCESAALRDETNPLSHALWRASSPFGGAGIEQSEMTERVPHGEKANRENPRLRSNEISGGRNREELLGQRPARRKCRLRHDADAGSRNPISGDHSKSYFFSVAAFHSIKLQPICNLVLQLGSISCIIYPARKCKLIANC